MATQGFDDLLGRNVRHGHTKLDALSVGGEDNYLTISSSGVITFTGTAGIALPHLMQSDSTTQSIANTTLAQVVTFNTDVHHHYITRTSSSRFTLTEAGSYLITWSGIASCPSAGNSIEFWLRIDGADVANSNTKYSFKGANAEAVIAVSFIEHFSANQYFEFWTCGSNTGAKWLATGAGSTPTRPAIPSIIITCNMVSKD